MTVFWVPILEPKIDPWSSKVSKSDPKWYPKVTSKPPKWTWVDPSKHIVFTVWMAHWATLG